MKRIITLLIVLLSVTQIYAQRDLTERRPIWFGVNMGGTWQTSDIKPVGGIGWGFTVARYSRISNPSPIYWGWRFRFLDGRNFGYNYHPLYGVTNNPVLGQGSGPNYSSGTDPDTGHIFSNYKMRFDEFAFEIVLGSNTLRKHGVLLYGFGGAGMTYWKTNTNQLDANGNLYDYSTIDHGGDESLVEQQLDAMLDDTYETNANGSVAGAQWGFMPSAGIGFGYQWSNFAIVAEHRTTWALNDLIDGTNHSSGGMGTDDGNDLYHYDGLTLRWNFSRPRSNNDNYTPPPLPPPVTGNPQPQPTPQPGIDPTPQPQPGPTPNIPGLQPPTVTFTTPATDPYVTSVLNQNLVVRVTNVAQSSQISLTINNQVSTNFSFNPATQTMTFNHTLQAGNNVYRVVATNSAGSAQDVQTITYKGQTDPQPTPTNPPPTVIITSPSTDPYTSTTQTYTVTATVANVASASGITVTRNGSPVTNFSFDPRTDILSFVTTLQSGNNAFNIVGTNTVGSASDAVTIVYGNANNPPAPVPPVVTITSPNACPYQTKTQTHTITATITNVTSANQVAVVFNNQTITNFSFTRGTPSSISFPVTLVSGNNPFTITGTNNAGTDSKACVITYKPQGPPPPDVTITTPSSDPFATTNPAFILKATVLNVASSAEITVTANNATIIGWTYDANSKVLTYSTTLNPGTTNYVVSASNANGSDSDNQSVVYRDNSPTPTALPPSVDITTPSANPFTTNNPAFTLKATVLNVASSSEITVTANNAVIQGWTYDLNSKVLTYSTTLNIGTTNYVVTATNTKGTDSDNQSVVYRDNSPTPTVLPPTVNITKPTDNPYITSTAQQTVLATVTNITQQSQITVTKFPNTQVPFTFNAATKEVSFSVTLTAGANQFTVTATNAGGTASDQTTLKLVEQSGGSGPSVPGQSPTVGRPPQGPPPSIALHVPSMSPVTTGSQTFPVTMIVTGVNSQSDITVKLNNVAITSGVTWNQNSGTLSFSTSLAQGQNNIQVSAQNTNGTTSRTLVVNYNAGNRQQQSGDPKKADPVKEEPKKDKPREVEPSKSEPVKEEPRKAEPAKAEPKKEEPKKEEPKKAEPAKEEPKKSESRPSTTTSPSSSPAPAQSNTPAPRGGTTTAPSRPR